MVEHVYGIIDSKIQFLDFKIKEMVKVKLGKLPDDILEEKNFLPAHFENLPDHDRILDTIEAYSRNISLLLLMRTTLSYLSAETAFFLLTNDKYLDFTDKQLRTILEEALYDQATQNLDDIIERAMIKLTMAQ